ncbi:MAG: TerB family tellurite resistance protein [Gammaproteobacteria bacterium]|nr:TerB family tellurite resistance protein [Gammaproteobacteria bacterium]
MTMLTILKDLLRGLGAEDAPSGPTLELAVVALLLEIGRADESISAAERATVLSAACTVLNVSEAQSMELLGAAAQLVEDSVSLAQFTGVLNQNLTLAAKRRCLVAMWQVAQADGRIDRYEEYYLRKLCDLLYLSHHDFIQAKLAVLGS